MKTAIILAFDRFALRMMGCYGNVEHPTPNIDRFAATAIVFDQHFAIDVSPAATRPWQSIELSGLNPAGMETQAVIEQGCLFSPPTAAFASCWELLPGDGTDDELRGSVGVIHAGMQTVQSWSGHHAGPRLLWLHAAGYPDDTTDDDEIEPTFQERYQLWIADIDNAFGGLSKAIAEYRKSSGDDLLLIVTAAEGTDLGENCGLPESFRTPPEFQRLGEAVTHTPLIIQASNAEMGTRRQSLVQTTDLWPTVCEWFDLPEATSDDGGRSLWTIVRDAADAVEREFVRLTDGDRATAIHTREWLLQTTPAVLADPPHSLDPTSVRLFVKPDDLWDVHNVTEQDPAEAERLLQILREHHGTPR